MGGRTYQEAVRIQRRRNGFFAVHCKKTLAFRKQPFLHASRRSLRAMYCSITMHFLAMEMKRYIAARGGSIPAR
jgi:hypothetical protein